MTNGISDGKTIDLVAPEGGCLAGDFITNGSLHGVAKSDAVAGDLVTCVPDGVFSLPKADESQSLGNLLYFTGGAFQKTASGAPRGICMADVAQAVVVTAVKLLPPAAADTFIDGTARAVAAAAMPTLTLASTDPGDGAALVGVEDDGDLYDGDTVEECLAEVKPLADAAIPKVPAAPVGDVAVFNDAGEVVAGGAGRVLATVKNFTGSTFAAKTIAAKVLFQKLGAGMPTSLDTTGTVATGATSGNTDAGLLYMTTAIDGDTTISAFKDSGMTQKVAEGVLALGEGDADDTGTLAAENASGLSVAIVGKTFGAGNWTLRVPLVGERLAVQAASGMDMDGVIGAGVVETPILAGASGDIVTLGPTTVALVDGYGTVKGDSIGVGAAGKAVPGYGALTMAWATETVALATPGPDVKVSVFGVLFSDG
jgi:predicted RecA/RadA family phage recombinase